MTRTLAHISILLFTSTALLTIGCSDTKKKGTPPPLSEEQRRALRQRSLYPNPGTISGTEGARTGNSATPQTAHQPEVRIDPSIARAKLNSRIQSQRDSGI